MRAQVTFIGNATTLLRLGEFTLLTDPAFGPAGSRVYLGYANWSKRLRDPVLKVLDGVTPDAMLLSHLHGDHFDLAARRRLDHALPIITTPEAARRLGRKGYTEVHGLPTWECHEWTRGDQRLRVTSVPGRHGPGFIDKLLPDVMGSVVELHENGRRALTIYITGDTLYTPALSEVPRRFGPIDAMLIHLGGTKLLGLMLTMDDRQGVEMGRLIRPDRIVPVHYDDYSVMASPLSDFLGRARAEGLTGVHPITRGDTLDLLPVS